MIFFRTVFSFALLTIAYFTAFSAEYSSELKASVSGYVKDKSNGETLLGATVSIPETKRGSKTNKSGFYSISNLTPGEYTVQISYIGYESVQKKITLKKKEKLRLDIELAVGEAISDEVIITAKREEDKREISVSKVNIPVVAIKEIRIGGESDVFRSLQMLPGVLTSSQISSGLFVRGGSPDQNLVLLDGATVYNPSHLFGFISTFNTDAIKDVELIKGGYPAQYGNRLSAVLNLTQKDGNREKFEGLASIGMLSSRLSLQVPLFTGSFMLSGRTTYLELIKKFMTEDPKNPLPNFNFYDLNAKISQDISADDKFFISGFMSKDGLTLDNTGVNLEMDISNKLASARWNRIWSDNVFSNVIISYSKYDNNLKVNQSGYKSLMMNYIEDYTGKINFEWFISDKITSVLGYELNLFKFSYLQNFTGETDSTQAGIGSASLNIKVNEVNRALFSHWNWQVTDLFSVQAGLRGYYWQQSDKFLVDPRLALRYQLDENTFAKFSWGIFHQSLRLASMPDFSFFDTWLPTDSTVGASNSQHFIASLETNIFRNINLSVDVYYKMMNEMGIINQTAYKGNAVRDMFEIGTAQAYGAEIFIQKQSGKFTGWFGYAFGVINATFANINYGKSFHPKYDRTHDLKLVLQYTLNKNWDFGANFIFQSGQSYTGATSRFMTKMPGEEYGHGKIVPSQKFGLRLPPSHQLNINAGYNHKLFGLNARTNVDIYNVYNHRDIWFRYYDTNSKTEGGAEVKDVKLLPIIPSISLEVHF